MKKLTFSTEFKVGLTVIISTLILVFGIIWGKEYRFKTNKFQLDLLFSEVGGLVVGDPVTVNGIKEGKVVGVSWKDRKVLCKVEINEHIQLYKDATFSVLSAEILAGMKIEIFPGKSNKHINLALQPFEGFYGGRIVDVGLIIGDVAEDMSALSIRIDSTVALVKSYLETGDLQNDISESFSNLNRMTKDFAGLSDSLKTTFYGVNNATSKLNKMIDDNSEGVTLSVRNLATLSSRLDTISTSVGRIMIEIDRKQGTLGKMIYDTTLYTQLNHTLNNIDSLAKQIKEDGLELNLF